VIIFGTLSGAVTDAALGSVIIGIRAERPTRRTARDARLDGGVAEAAGERARCVPDEKSEMKWDR